MEANIFIKSVELKPNPVYAGSFFTISAEIRNRPCVIADTDGSILADADGALIETEE